MIYGMPGSAVETGCVDMVLPLDAIANHLESLVKGN
jgi:chemotaxis response regulator CheB